MVTLKIEFSPQVMVDPLAVNIEVVQFALVPLW